MPPTVVWAGSHRSQAEQARPGSRLRRQTATGVPGGHVAGIFLAERRENGAWKPDFISRRGKRRPLAITTTNRVRVAGSEGGPLPC